MSRMFQIFKFVFIEMFSPCFLNSRVMSFLIVVRLLFLGVLAHRLCRVLRCFLPYFSLRLFRRKRPISSQTSAPSKLPIVTSNMSLWFFLVQAVSLSNRSDFRQCMIMSMSLSLIVV